MFWHVTIRKVKRMRQYRAIKNAVSFGKGKKKMTKEVERGTLICPKKSTKHLIQGIIYKVVGQTITGRHYAVRCPYEGTKHYIHKNNIRVMS